MDFIGNICKKLTLSIKMGSVYNDRTATKSINYRSFQKQHETYTYRWGVCWQDRFGLFTPQFRVNDKKKPVVERTP